MSEIKATPRKHSSAAFLADILFPTRDFANKAKIPDMVPLLGGMGLGDIFVGKSPELLDDISYDGPKRMLRYPDAPGVLAKTQLDKRVADVAFLGADIGTLGTFALRKAIRKATEGLKKSSVNQARREFLSGKEEALASPKTEVESAIKGGLDIPMNRRTFNKTAALVGGAAAVGAGGLLRKFAKEGGEVAAKGADNAGLAATKNYKYNSLKEYLDDVRASGDEFVDLTAGEGKQADFMKQRLLRDEATYKDAKDLFYNPKGLSGRTLPKDTPIELYDESLSMFSPQAKQEMKALKEISEFGGRPWTDMHDFGITPGKIDHISPLSYEYGKGYGNMSGKYFETPKEAYKDAVAGKWWIEETPF